MIEESDPSLSSEVRKFGVFNARGCFSCGSCTVVCDLATAADAFPRRVMQSVMLGLRDSVRRSLDPWLCHDCGDCSTTCPRQADPQQSMMTLRRYLTAQYDWTGLASKIYRSPAWEISALSLVAVLVLSLAVSYHIYFAKLPWSIFTAPMGLGHMFNKITYFTLAAFLIPAVLVLSHAFRMFRLTQRGYDGAPIPLRHYLEELKILVVNSVAHVQFLKCPAASYRKRWALHWLLAFGCVLMCVVKVFFLNWFQTDQIYPIHHPQRWLGYVAAAGLILGALDILIGRIRKQAQMYRHSEWSDMTLPVLLLLTALSGLAVHILRYMGLALASHYTYAIHLMIAVPMLVVEVPFGKWSHMIYRPLALYFAAVRARASREETPQEVLAA